LFENQLNYYLKNRNQRLNLMTHFRQNLLEKIEEFHLIQMWKMVRFLLLLR
jgi:hypothetical protein